MEYEIKYINDNGTLFNMGDYDNICLPRKGECIALSDDENATIYEVIEIITILDVFPDHNRIILCVKNKNGLAQLMNTHEIFR